MTYRVAGRDWITLDLLGVVRLLGLIPSLTLVCALIVDLLTWWAWLIGSVLLYLARFHRPTLVDSAQRLIFDEISSSGDFQRLVDPMPAELQLLRKLAQADLESAEKRLLPTALFLTALGIMAPDILPHLMSFGQTAYQAVIASTRGLPFASTLQAIIFGSCFGASSPCL